MIDRKTAPETSKDAADKLLRFAVAREVVGISRSKIYLLLGQGRFPRPVKVGRSNFFSSTELQDWISSQLRDRPKGKA